MKYVFQRGRYTNLLSSVGTFWIFCPSLFFV